MAAPPTEPRVVQLLSSYWCARPLASDTAAGVHRWWLPESHEFTLGQVTAALAWMVERALIEANPTPDARIRYRRSPGASQAEFDRLASGALDSPAPTGKRAGAT